LPGSGHITITSLARELTDLGRQIILRNWIIPGRRSLGEGDPKLTIENPK